MIGAIVDFAIWVLGLFGFGKQDPSAGERAAGRELGQQETQNANAQAGLDEVQRAVKARQDNSAALDANPGRLLNGKDQAAAGYKPGPD